MRAKTQAGFLALHAAAQDACHPLTKSDSFLSTLPFCAPSVLLYFTVVREITWTTLAFWQATRENVSPIVQKSVTE